MKTTEAADFFNLHKVFPKFSHKGNFATDCPE